MRININITSGSGGRRRALTLLAGSALLGGPLLAGGCDDGRKATDGLIVVRDDVPDRPLAGLTAQEQDVFDRGDALFEKPFRETQGLGPLYIRQSCVSCHADDAKGPGAVTKMAPQMTGAEPPATNFPYGHTVRPQRAAGATRGITLLPGVFISVRVGPAVFGRGFIDAVSDAEIERVESEQRAAGGPVSGRIHRVSYQSQGNPGQHHHTFVAGQAGLMGRFGLKARIATLDDFSADALQGDMGLTSPLRPQELPNPDGLADDFLPGVDVSAESVNLLADYVRALDIPDRPTPDPAALMLYQSTGCGTCHVPTLRTRPDYPLAMLAGIDAPIYSDLLLHDMGEALADGIVDGDATGSEWRTAPLMGLRFFSSYLHDGRAASIREAVELHGGAGSEAAGSAQAFGALSAVDQQKLLDFVAAL